MRAILLGPLAKGHRLLKPKKSDFLIGVDGGARIWLKAGIKPHLIVGDLDSFRPKARDLFRILILPREKGRSDLFYSVIAAINAGADQIICMGVTGGRPDHHLAVLLDLTEIAATKEYGLKSVSALGSEADYYFLSSFIPVWRARMPRGRIVSIFSLGPQLAEGVTFKGLKYPLHEAKLFPSSQGLSNEVVNKDCEIRLKKGNLLVVIPK